MSADCTWENELEGHAVSLYWRCILGRRGVTCGETTAGVLKQIITVGGLRGVGGLMTI